MKHAIVIQSYQKKAPQWVKECAHSVELWCEAKGYDYLVFGDEMFEFVATRHGMFPKVTRTDIFRLRMIQRYLDEYERVYWLDADFLIWDIHNFRLPEPKMGHVVCAREAFRQFTGTTSLAFNNSVLGFCCENDVELLIEKSEAILDEWRDKYHASAARPTIIGTDYFSSWRFPLERIIAKQAGCFSQESINLILGPWVAGRYHLKHLGWASGAKLCGANLCSSRETDEKRMMRLVKNLTLGYHLPVGRMAHFASIYRAWLHASNLPERIRCWCLTRWRNLRGPRSVFP